MPITAQEDQWLRNAGYEYHCFISWPHINNNNLKKCARKIKEFIEQDLALDIHEPKVFLDEIGIHGGEEWEKVLRRVLCRSVVMVALCSPIYYSPVHRWCGLEWATVELLSSRRLANEELHTILPIIVKDHRPPEVVSRIQYLNLNLSGQVVNGYYRSRKFQQTGRSIVEHIERVVSKLVSNNARANCENFQIASESAFVGYEEVHQPPPLRS